MFVEQGSVVRNIRDSIATLDEQTATGLTPEELSGIAQQLTLANIAFNNLYTLRCDKAWLPNSSLEFIKRGYFDIDGVVPALRRSDTHPCNTSSPNKNVRVPYPYALLRTGGEVTSHRRYTHTS